MKLTCSRCGYTASADGFTVDAAYKQALALGWKLPAAVQAELPAYLALMNPPSRSMTGKRMLAVLQELAQLVGAAGVDFDGQPPRRCPPALWAEGMRQMIERKGGQARHFKNHNYLRSIVYDLANRAAAAGEARARTAEQHHRRPTPEPDAPGPAPTEPDEGAAQGLSQAAREQLRAIVGLVGSIGRKLP